MVRSRLEEPVASGDGDSAVPRVSQYRLAAHLCTALALYVGMFADVLSITAGLALHAQWYVGRNAAQPARAPLQGARRDRYGLSSSPHYPVRLSPSASFLACVGLNLGPGAFVAGLDAGLAYNEH